VNGQQVDGLTKDVMNIEPLGERAAAFGAAVCCVNGHNVEELAAAAETPHDGKPLVIFCYTDPAQGIPLLEARKPKLHYIQFKGEAERAEFAAFLQTM
jgi:transketolase